MGYRAAVHPDVPGWAAAALTGSGWLGRTTRAAAGTPWLRPFVGALGVVGGLGVVKGLVVAPAAAVVGGGVALLLPGVVLGGAHVASRTAARAARRYGHQVFTADQLTRAASEDAEFDDAVTRVQRAVDVLSTCRAWRDGWLPVTGYDLAAAEWRATESAWRAYRLRRDIADSAAPVARELAGQLAAETEQLAPGVADLETAAALAVRVGGLLPEPALGSGRSGTQSPPSSPGHRPGPPPVALPESGAPGSLAAAVAGVLELLGDPSGVPDSDGGR